MESLQRERLRPAALQIFRAWYMFLKEGVADGETKT
jgi:hypothetical protein